MVAICVLIMSSLVEAEYNFKCLFLTMPRLPLKQRIDSRCELIVEQGLFPVSQGLSFLVDC